ncbi:hypothetical protein [Qipengyuania sp. NPDC077563]|uniref:hypothetical protein n=1 Tax=Qipengyuania sp. NPDC077563 TaxID=3364497 RepID=UPI00384AC727
MIEIPEGLDETIALINLKEIEFEHAKRAVDRAIAEGKTGEAEFKNLREIAFCIGKLLKGVAEGIHEELSSS